MSDKKLETPEEYTEQETRKRVAHEEYDEPAKKRPKKRGLVKVIDVQHMLAQWVHEKNATNDLDPKEVSAQSHRKAWFRCDQNHERLLVISNLYKSKGCLMCVLANKRWNLEKLKQMSRINEDTGCHIWEGPDLIGSKNRTWSPHGLALYLATGKHVNKEMPHVRHLCGNATCVNPEHLQLGTAMENAMDKDVTKTQLNGEKNHKSKLSDEERKSIYASQETNSILAEHYGVSVNTISRIKTGTTGSAVTQSHEQQLKVREHERKRRKAAKPLTKEDYVHTMERCFKKCKLVKAEPNDTSIVLQKPCRVFQGYLMAGYGATTVKRKHELLHRLVAMVVHNNGQLIASGFVVRHLCTNKACCEAEHLAIGTKSENAQDISKAGNHPLRKLSDDDVRAIRCNESGRTMTELAERYNVSGTAVWRICHGRTFKHVV